jgi:hypothetical protein
MLTDQELLEVKEEDYSTLSDEEIVKLEGLKSGVKEEGEGDGEADKDVDDDGDGKKVEGNKEGEREGKKKEDGETDSEYEKLLKTKNWDNDGLAKGYSEVEKYAANASTENAELKKKLEEKEIEEKVRKEYEAKNVDPIKLKEETDAKASQLVLDLNDAEKAPQILENVIRIAEERAMEKMKSGDIKGLLEEKEKRDEERRGEVALGQMEQAVGVIAEKYYDGDKVKAEIHFKKIVPKINEIYDEHTKRFEKGLATVDLRNEPGSLNMVLGQALLETGLPKKTNVSIDTGEKRKKEVKNVLTSSKFVNMTVAEKTAISDEDLDAAIEATRKG